MQIEGLAGPQSRFLPEIDAHNPPEQLHYAHCRTTEAVHFRGNTVLGGIMEQRFKNIGVGLRISAEELSEYRDKPAQISKIKRAPQRIVRFSKIEDQQSSAGLCNPQHF